MAIPFSLDCENVIWKMLVALTHPNFHNSPVAHSVAQDGYSKDFI
jgi:hypothetical protein